MSDQPDELQLDHHLALQAESLFGSAAKRVGVAIVVGVLFLGTIHPLLPWQLTRSLTMGVSLACGMVSLAALAPGLHAGRTLATNWRRNAVENGPKQPLDRILADREQTLVKLATVGGLLAMAIRSLGTIALFVGCRYQFAHTAKQVAFLVVGWYVLLTFMEVHSLTRGICRLDSSRNHRLTNSGETIPT